MHEMSAVPCQVGQGLLKVTYQAYLPYPQGRNSAEVTSCCFTPPASISRTRDDRYGSNVNGSGQIFLSWCMAYIGTVTVVPAGMTTPLENAKSLRATQLIVTEVKCMLVLVYKGSNEFRTGTQSVDTLGLLEKAIHFDHSINSGLGPSILFDDRVDLFTENGGVFGFSSEMIQCMRKVLRHRSVNADDMKGCLTSEVVWIPEN
jgi:hypothetical protein